MASFLPQIAAAMAPAVMNAGAQTIGQMAGSAMGNAGARAATAGLNSDPVSDTLNKAGIQLDPNQQAQLQQHYSRQAAQDNLNQSMQAQAFGAGIANTGANLSTERQMAVNAQANAAQNVANQLSALRDRSRDNAQAINQAMSSAMGAFR